MNSETKQGRPKRLHGVKRYTVQLDIDDAEWAKAQTNGLASLTRLALKHLRYRIEKGIFVPSEVVNE